MRALGQGLGLDPGIGPGLRQGFGLGLEPVLIVINLMILFNCQKIIPKAWYIGRARIGTRAHRGLRAVARFRIGMQKSRSEGWIILSRNDF
jgi:hypothetical protein